MTKFSELPLQIEDKETNIKAPTRGQDPKEITDLIIRAKSEDKLESEKAKNKLYFAYKNAVEKQVNYYTKKGTAGKGYYSKVPGIREDLLSAAWYGFFNALKLYDVNSGVPFGIYIQMQIKHYCTLEFKKSKIELTKTNSETVKKFMKWIKENCKSTEDIDIEKASRDLGIPEAVIREDLTARSQNYISFSGKNENEDFQDFFTNHSKDPLAILTGSEYMIREVVEEFDAKKNITRDKIAKALYSKFTGYLPTPEEIAEIKRNSYFRDVVKLIEERNSTTR